jgi:shikimate 5-dehydrogenase
MLRVTNKVSIAKFASGCNQTLFLKGNGKRVFMKPFRVAIVGTGGIARSHMAALQHEQARVDVVAAVDVAPQNLKAFCEEKGTQNTAV